MCIRHDTPHPTSFAFSIVPSTSSLVGRCAGRPALLLLLSCMQIGFGDATMACPPLAVAFAACPSRSSATPQGGYYCIVLCRPGRRGSCWDAHRGVPMGTLTKAPAPFAAALFLCLAPLCLSALSDREKRERWCPLLLPLLPLPVSRPATNNSGRPVPPPATREKCEVPAPPVAGEPEAALHWSPLFRLLEQRAQGRPRSASSRRRS